MSPTAHPQITSAIALIAIQAWIIALVASRAHSSHFAFDPRDQHYFAGSITSPTVVERSVGASRECAANLPGSSDINYPADAPGADNHGRITIYNDRTAVRCYEGVVGAQDYGRSNIDNDRTAVRCYGEGLGADNHGRITIYNDRTAVRCYEGVVGAQDYGRCSIDNDRTAVRCYEAGLGAR